MSDPPVDDYTCSGFEQESLVNQGSSSALPSGSAQEAPLDLPGKELISPGEDIWGDYTGVRDVYDILQLASDATNGSMASSQPPLVYPPSQERPTSRWQPQPPIQDIQIFSAVHDFKVPPKSFYTDGSSKDIGGCSSVAIHPNGKVYACRPFGPPSPYRGEIFAIWLATIFASPQQKIFSDCKGAIKAIMGTKTRVVLGKWITLIRQNIKENSYCLRTYLHM